jgi:hypothetical protein
MGGEIICHKWAGYYFSGYLLRMKSAVRTSVYTVTSIFLKDTQCVSNTHKSFIFDFFTYFF